MLRQPHLIDVLSDALAPEAFAWDDNADLYRLILELHADGNPVDVITLSDRRTQLPSGTRMPAVTVTPSRATDGGTGVEV
ncbi:hypothetical protein MXL15_25430 [Pseudomonas mosselii]|uniref:DnaB-like helicase N-terminal domain-containing protein n=1 Tax=Pseudomonas mosselii TaxID=78327 RepID=UPI002DCC9F4D|nr:hypothetical protein [Pseudomonas mosselii]